MTLVLVGMPGCGKSTVGRQLARNLGWTFCDSDVEIERRLGTSIRAHFELFGEASFRDLEQSVLHELSERDQFVLATGGGSVLREANRMALKRLGRNWVVYLRATPEELARRLRHDVHRPLLQGGDPLQKLRALFEQRDGFYRDVADVCIDTGRGSVSNIANTVIMQMETSRALSVDRPSRA